MVKETRDYFLKNCLFRKDNFYKIYKLILKIKIREFHKGNTENSLMKGSITHVKS